MSALNVRFFHFGRGQSSMYNITHGLFRRIVFGVSYCHQTDKARRAQISERMTRGESNATNAATSAVLEYSERQSDRDATTRANNDAIQAAPNSRDTAGAAGDAGLRGLCDRPSYRNDPVCLRLKDSAATSR